MSLSIPNASLCTAIADTNNFYRENLPISEQQQAPNISEFNNNTRTTAQLVAQKNTRNTSYLYTANTQDPDPTPEDGLTPEEQEQLDQDIKRAKSVDGEIYNGFSGLSSEDQAMEQKIEQNVINAKKEAEAAGKAFTAADIDAVMESTLEDTVNSIDPSRGKPTPNLTGKELKEIEEEADKIYDTGAAGTKETKEQFEEYSIQMARLNNKYEGESGKGHIDENDIDKVVELVAQTLKQHSPDTHTSLWGDLMSQDLIYIPDPKA